ncbi:hypothetical protein QR680_010872 [Steinernema hermaphroditum]|uniref:Uncharacterized protein n=1 Tax=Steinernema hermaphroditum TaxID=289476 RepID=A0AA39IQE6_9BILA|nr:hypothetical protein QR680_010872 [Steinernema hermaphroditum]
MLADFYPYELDNVLTITTTALFFPISIFGSYAILFKTPPTIRVFKFPFFYLNSSYQIAIFCEPPIPQEDHIAICFSYYINTFLTMVLCYSGGSLFCGYIFMCRVLWSMKSQVSNASKRTREMMKMLTITLVVSAMIPTVLGGGPMLAAAYSVITKVDHAEVLFRLIFLTCIWQVRFYSILDMLTEFYPYELDNVLTITTTALFFPISIFGSYVILFKTPPTIRAFKFPFFYLNASYQIGTFCIGVFSRIEIMLAANSICINFSGLVLLFGLITVYIEIFCAFFAVLSVVNAVFLSFLCRYCQVCHPKSLYSLYPSWQKAVN